MVLEISNRFILLNGLIATSCTSSPICAELSGSCAKYLAVLRISFSYILCFSSFTISTTAVLFIAVDMTRPFSRCAMHVTGRGTTWVVGWGEHGACSLCPPKKAEPCMEVMAAEDCMALLCFATACHSRALQKPWSSKSNTLKFARRFNTNSEANRVAPQVV